MVLRQGSVFFEGNDPGTNRINANYLGYGMIFNNISGAKSMRMLYENGEMYLYQSAKAGIPLYENLSMLENGPKVLAEGKELAEGGSFKVSGSKGLLLLEVANSSARSRKMEVFIKGINAERNIHISYADGTSQTLRLQLHGVEVMQRLNVLDSGQRGSGAVEQVRFITLIQFRR